MPVPTPALRLDLESGARVLHARVRGRIRVQVYALYRNAALAHYLSDQLGAIEQVQKVNVSTLTATVLLRYSRDTESDELLALLARILELPEIPAPTAARTARCRCSTQGARLGGEWRKIWKRLWNARTFADRPAQGALTVPDNHNWHALPAERVLQTLASDREGLAHAEALRRLQRFGFNELETVQARSPLAILVEQFLTLPVGLLAISAGISIATGGVTDAAVIAAVVLINASIGYVTERKADLTIQGLGAMVPRDARVIREGVELRVEVLRLVPGDLIKLEPGSYVGADLRLLETTRLTLDESALTGESMPVEKQAERVCPPELPLAERVNLAYRGTLVTGGSGSGVVVGTAQNTEIGRIQALAAGVASPDTPMQRQLGELGTQLGILSAAICGGVFLVGLLRGVGGIEMLRSAVSLAVAAVPEGLPAVATTTLALGINRMRQHHVAVRHLDAVETLGSVQIFCLDKTGTLTFNRMSAASLVLGREPIDLPTQEARRTGVARTVGDTTALEVLLSVLALCNEARLDEKGQLAGSPTELALLELAASCGLDVNRAWHDHELLELHQRAEGRPLLSTLHRWTRGRRLIGVKGSPSQILERCDWLLETGRPLSQADRAAILALNEGLASRAERVLGVAYKVIDDEAPFETRALIWLGLVGMQDPLRPGMQQLMATYHRAGIKTVMITGDQSATAQALAEQLGLSADHPVKILDAGRLEKLDPDLLAALVPEVDVFARVSPAHKLRIVQAYQRGGHVVAMTGDGINDGPALKAADIGVAMGRSGTDVARSVADVVLQDDNLHTMEVAVGQGRTIYANIRKTIHFLLATNFSEIELMMAGIAMGTSLPLSPMQLLWINLLSDIFPGLALSMEPAEPDVMRRKPRDASELIVTRSALLQMGRESLIITGGALASLGYGLWRYGPGPISGTLAFQTLTTAQLIHALSCRSSERVLWGAHQRPANPYLRAALLGSLGLQALTLVVPGLRRLLGSSPLGLLDLGVVAATAGLPLIINEALKPGEARRPSRTEPLS